MEDRAKHRTALEGSREVIILPHPLCGKWRMENEEWRMGSWIEWAKECVCCMVSGSIRYKCCKYFVSAVGWTGFFHQQSFALSSAHKIGMA